MVRFFANRLDPAPRMLLLAAAIALLGGWRINPAAAADNAAPSSPLHFDRPRPVDLIPPGTVVGAKGPAGWSHLIVKSKPRLPDAEAKKVFPMVAKHATLLSTVVLADVGDDPQRGGKCLRKLALGYATNVRGQDVVVSSASAKEIGADLGLVGGMILSQSERRLGEFVVIARSPTLAILDVSGVMLLDEKHRDVILRYAFSVDRRSGRLDSLLWLLVDAKQPEYRLASSAIRRVTPDLVEDCQLHVDPTQITAGIPSDKAFAVFGAPPGQNATIPQRLMPLLERRTLDFEWLSQLERELQAISFDAPR